MKIEISGSLIKNERDFHNQLAKILGVENYYGCNIDALWDLLSVGVERPLDLQWIDSSISRMRLEDSFEKIISVFNRVKLQDEYYGWEDKFTYILK